VLDRTFLVGNVLCNIYVVIGFLNSPYCLFSSILFATTVLLDVVEIAVSDKCWLQAVDCWLLVFSHLHQNSVELQ